MKKQDQVCNSDVLKTICGKRAGFPFYVQGNTEVIIFPQALWKVRVNETNNDYVIWINIQRRIKSKIWSAQFILIF